MWLLLLSQQWCPGVQSTHLTESGHAGHVHTNTSIDPSPLLLSLKSKTSFQGTMLMCSCAFNWVSEIHSIKDFHPYQQKGKSTLCDSLSKDLDHDNRASQHKWDRYNWPKEVVIQNFDIILMDLGRDRLLVLQTLHNRTIVEDPTCSRCNVYHETSFHVVRECTTSAVIWELFHIDTPPPS